MIPGTTRYVIRNQPHDVHDRSHMMWYVYDELRGMWYQIKQKQQKMPKARANINAYSSARISGVIFEDEKTVPYNDDTRNCMVCGTKSDRPPCFVPRKGPSMPRLN